MVLMPSKNLKFQFHPRLMSHLSEEYRSTERALKELVDNAWDADADHVWITLPTPGTAENPLIVVKDDGVGMTESQLEAEYLYIARNRQAQFGTKTHGKKRKIKGIKGIGKFAGLMAADVMQLETAAKGVKSRFEISREDLQQSELALDQADLSQIDLPVGTEPCPADEHGTTITLSRLNQRFTFPSADAFKQLLIIEYSRHPEFKVYVNGELLSIAHLPGKTFEEQLPAPDGGTSNLVVTLATKVPPGRVAGISIRVQGKTIGSPSLLGLEQDESIPRRLLKRVFGEIEADHLVGDTTPDLAGFIENSKPYQELVTWARGIVRAKLEDVYADDIKLEKKRMQQLFNRELSKLPEYRREFAMKAIERIVRSHYGNNTAAKAVIGVFLDALEKDDYHYVLKALDEAQDSDVSIFAGALEEFGLTDMSLMLRQAMGRLHFLDHLEKLALNKDTLEKDMHQALEGSLWIFGNDYLLMSSNRTLTNIIETYYQEKYTGPRAKKRPDLLLSHQTHDTKVLIEFKRPDHKLVRDDENQLLKYRADLRNRANVVRLLLVGGTVSDDLLSGHHQDVECFSYLDLISQARFQLDWLIKELRASR
ncbi:DNA mismatch repair protein [compost metagenome]